MTEAVGTLAEEAAKLLGAAESWWREHAPAASGTAAETAAGAAPHTGPECRICPLCQVLSAVRGAQPELFEHVSDAALALLATLRGAVEEHRPGRRGADVPVEHIDIA